jgi:hypothetical protein
VSTQAATFEPDGQWGRWVPALADRVYDRRGELTGGELDALEAFAALRGRGGRVPHHAAARLARLVAPIEDVLAFVAPRARWWARLPARSALLGAMHAERHAFWAWSREGWVRVLERTDPDVRQLVMAVAYLLCGQRDLHREFPGFKRRLFARRVFGSGAVDEQVGRVRAHLDSFGYAATLGRPGMMAALFDLMLCAGSPLLEDVAARPQALGALHAHGRPVIRHGVAQLTSALVGMGVLERSPLGPDAFSDEAWIARSSAPARGVPEGWAAWVARWFCTSTLASVWSLAVAPPSTWESQRTSQQMNAVIVVPAGVGTEELTTRVAS